MIFKNQIKKFLLQRNYWVSRKTEKNKLIDFFNLVKPVKTEHELVRIGGEADGGYLVPDDLINLGACFSPGVSNVSDFENCLTIKGIKCFMADYSVDNPPITNSLFDFQKKYLGTQNNEKYMTLKSWVDTKVENEKDLILQMDIEGAEYSIILDAPLEYIRKFRILVIEFHDLDYLYNRIGFDLINLTFTKILKDFEILHIHPNNCIKPLEFKEFSIPPIMEFTFLRKDRIKLKTKNTTFPHKLDKPNLPNNDNFHLPKCWF
jgi:hypothetical protein